MSTDSSVAGRIDLLLERHKVTIKDFATAIGLPYRTVQNYLTGNVKIPVDFLRKCCDYFGVEADYVLFGGIDLSRVAMVTAIETSLKEILSRLDLKNGEVIVGENKESHIVASEVIKSYRSTIALMISSEIRDTYIQNRTNEIHAGVRNGVSPADEAATQRRMRFIADLGR